MKASISVSPIVIDLKGKEQDAEIAVKNFDTQQNAYVEVIPYRIIDPVNSQLSKKRIRQPEKDGLLVFPGKLILLPGQTQFVRIVKTAKNVSADQIYEVDFIPKITTHLVSKETSSGAKLGIRIIVGYGARVTLRPEKALPGLLVKRHNQELLIKNTGNTTLNIVS